jgi:ubiquinone/menaquinone biosynthesis C-methylase UbiE
MVAVAVVGVAVTRHRLGAGRGHQVPGGILIGDVAKYDAFSRLLLGPLFDRLAAEVASGVGQARVLEVGCGPGHLSLRMATHPGLEVTGIDLDPAMIERAMINAERMADPSSRPNFAVADVGSLPYPDASFDLVVSSLSMHHWSDPAGGLAEIGRVLGGGGRALIWDFRPGRMPFHRSVPDPVELGQASSLEVVSKTPWNWPWRFTLLDRIELTHRSS